MHTVPIFDEYLRAARQAPSDELEAMIFSCVECFFGGRVPGGADYDDEREKRILRARNARGGGRRAGRGVGAEGRLVRTAHVSSTKSTPVAGSNLRRSGARFGGRARGRFGESAVPHETTRL